MPQRLRIAALQLPLRWNHPMPNMIAIRAVAEELPSAVEVIVLPEAWTGLPQGCDVDKTAAEALQFLQTMARKCRTTVIGGSIESRNDQGDVQNVAIVVDPHGDIVGRYAKRVLYSKERDHGTAGGAPGIFEVAGWRIGVLICADLWRHELMRELIDRVDVVCVPAKTAVPSDNHVLYARQLWHSLALTRAMETGLPVVVSDWSAGRHSPHDVDRSVGSVHASGTTFDRGILAKRHRDPNIAPTTSGVLEPTATAHTSATPALGVGVHFTSGASTICNPGHRPDIAAIQKTLPLGEPGYLLEEIDRESVSRYTRHRRDVGLL